MGCICCKRDYEVEEERKPLLEGGEYPPQYAGPTLFPTKDSDDGFFVIDHEPSKNVEILSLESKDERDGSFIPIHTTPSPSQVLVSVQDKSAAFSHSVPISNVAGKRSFQSVAQTSTSLSQQVTPPDIVSTNILPEADLTKSALSAGACTPDPPVSSHAGITATVCDDIETDQAGSLSLTRTAAIALDTEQSDSDAAATELNCTANSVPGDIHPAGNDLSDATPLLSAIAPSASEDPTDTQDGPRQYLHHEQPVTQSLLCSEEDNSVQANFMDSAVLSSQLSSIGYHSISSEAETRTADTSYTGGPQGDVEISAVDTGNEIATVRSLDDVEMSVVETENQTTSAVGAETSAVVPEDQTAATSSSGGTQSDAEISTVDTENKITIGTESQATPASYTGGVQNDAEVSDLDLPHSSSCSIEDVDSAPLLQYDETERTFGDLTDGTNKETALRDSAVLSSQLSSIGYHSISSEAETRTADASYTGGPQGDVEISAVDTDNEIATVRSLDDAEISMTETEIQTTSAVETELSVDDTKDQAADTSYTGGPQGDAEISAVDTGNEIATVRSLDDAEMPVVETENQTTSAVGAETSAVVPEDQTAATSVTGGTQNDTEISAVDNKNEITTARSLDDGDMSVVETEIQTSSVVDAELSGDDAKDQATATSFTGGAQNDAEISAVDAENEIATVRSLDDAEMSVVETENQTASTIEAETSAVVPEDQTAATSFTRDPQSDAEISAVDTENEIATVRSLDDAEMSVVEIENQTTSAVDAETSAVVPEDQTSATSSSGGTQSDAEISAVDTENKITVDTENQATPASYAGGVQNDAEVSNLDLPHSSSGSIEDVDGVPLLQYDETEHTLGGRTNGTTKEAALTPRSLDSIHVSLKKNWYDHLRTRVNLLKMAGSPLHREFEALKAITPRGVQYTSAQHQVNSSKNRPAAPVPPDTNAMVKLQSLYCAEDFDYVNACYVGSPSRPRAYIVTQTPMGNTVGDFWRMVWEQCASVIVLLTQKMEHLGGLNPKFWPEKGITNHYGLVQSGNWMTGSLSIRTTKEVKDRQIKDLVTRHIELRSEHPVTFSEVELYHYLGWPHHGVARSHKDVVLLLNRMMETRDYRPEKVQAECPVIVVSTHGAGRAGCFSAIAVAHELMTAPQENPPCWTRGDHILDEVVRGLRECRSGLVEDRFQFEFCHHVLFEALTVPKGNASPGKRRKGDHKQEVKSKKKGHTQKKKLSLA